MDSHSAIVLIVGALALTIAATVMTATLAMAVVSTRRIDASTPRKRKRKRLTHKETAAVEDAMVLAAELGAILHTLRRGPDAYPEDLSAGALWRAAVEVLERDGHIPAASGGESATGVVHPEGKNGDGGSAQ